MMNQEQYDELCRRVSVLEGYAQRQLTRNKEVDGSFDGLLFTINNIRSMQNTQIEINKSTGELIKSVIARVDDIARRVYGEGAV